MCRRHVLYSTELREHFLFHDAKILKIFGITKLFNNFFHYSIFNVVPFVFQHCKDMENISLFQIFCNVFSIILFTMRFILFVFEPFDKFVIELNEVICVKVLNIISFIGIDIVVDTDFIAWEI